MALGLFSTVVPYHLLAYSLAFGTNVFHSYINAPLQFKNLKREDFSKITNLTLPKYFLFQAVVPLGLYLTTPVSFDPTLRRASLVLLGLAGAVQALNYFWILPNVQSLKEQKLQLEEKLKKDGDGDNNKEIKTQLKSLTKRFGQYHGLSLLLNLVNTVTLTGYGFVLSNGLMRFIPK